MTLDEIMSLDASDVRRTRKIKKILVNQGVDPVNFALYFTSIAKKEELQEFSQILVENFNVKQDTLIFALDSIGAFEDILIEAAERVEQERE